MRPGQVPGGSLAETPGDAPCRDAEGGEPTLLAIHHAAGVGGGSISFLDVLEMLREDYNVVTSCPDDPPFLSSALKMASYEYRPCHLPIPVFNHYNGGSRLLSRTFWSGLLRFLRYRRDWVAFIQSQRPEVVIVNSAVMVLMGSLARKSGAKSLCFVRETFPARTRSIRTRLLYRILDRNFDGVVFLSKCDKDAARLSSAASVVVRDCARPGMFQRLDRQDACSLLGVPVDTFNILFTGGMSPIKGLEVALESLRYQDSVGTRLIVAGEMAGLSREVTRGGGLKRALRPRALRFLRSVQHLLSEPAVGERNILVGPQTDMAPCYSAADVVIFPSKTPHQARPVFEAGMYSLPIVISDFPQTGEFVEHEVNGLTVEPGSAQALGFALLRLCDEKPMAEALGRANRLRAETEHDFERERRELLAFVRELMA